jgi:hypothetical protein
MTHGGRVKVGTVCVCTVSPLGHSIAPVFLQVSDPGRCHAGVRNGLVIPP